jgi:hypothetical protein
MVFTAMCHTLRVLQTETYQIGAVVVNCFMWHFLLVIRKIKIIPCTDA